MESKIGEEFDAIVSAPHQRVHGFVFSNPHVEGKLVKDMLIKVGQKLKARLIQVNIERVHRFWTGCMIKIGYIVKQHISLKHIAFKIVNINNII